MQVYFFLKNIGQKYHMTRVSPVNNTVNQCVFIKTLQMTSTLKTDSMIFAPCSTIIGHRYVLPSLLLLFPTSVTVPGWTPTTTPKDTQIVWCRGFWTGTTWHGRLRTAERLHIATQTVRRRSRRRTFITCRTTWFSPVCRWPETGRLSYPRDISKLIVIILLLPKHGTRYTSCLLRKYAGYLPVGHSVKKNVCTTAHRHTTAVTHDLPATILHFGLIWYDFSSSFKDVLN